MKNLILLFLGLLLATIGQAQVTKTVNLTSAGTLSTVLTANEMSSTVSLALTGTIDARDFKTMRDSMPLLADLDLSEVSIVAYEGTEGTSIFGNNTYLANTIPETAFMDDKWHGKTSLSSVIFPSTITSFGVSAFEGCLGLKGTLIIPSTVTNIGDYAFSGCRFSTIEVPTSVISIGLGAFRFVDNSIVVNPSNPNYTSVEGVLFDKAQTYLMQCPTSKAGSYSIPPSVNTVGRYAFEACSGLNSIAIPLSVEHINNEAFSGCSLLQTINVSSTIPIDLTNSNNVFYNVDKNLCTLYVPAGTKVAYQAANQWQDFLHIIDGTGLWLSNASKNIPSNAGNAQLTTINGNSSWTVTSNQTWLTVSPTQGNGNGVLNISYAENTTGAQRMAKVTITDANNITYEVAINQTLEIEVDNLVVKRTTKAPVADGLIDANDPWGNEWIAINKVHPSSTTTDMSASFQLLAGSDALYLAIKVDDETPNNGVEISNDWERDCSEIFLSMDTVATENGGEYKTGSWLLQTQREHINGLYISGKSHSSSNWDITALLNDPKFSASSKSTATGYVQEYILPFSVLKGDYNWNEEFFRFDLHVTDNTTGADGGRTQHNFWNNTSDNQWMDTRALGVARLEPMNMVDVTFRVNMQGQTISPNGVHLNGSFFNWQNAIAMTPDVDGYYSATIQLHEGETFTYKFINGGTLEWGNYEIPPSKCTVGGANDRQITVASTNMVLDPVCFGSCYNCDKPDEVHADIQRTPVAPTIDGTPDYIWSKVAPIPINKAFVGENPTVQATWKAIYDSTNIYLLVEVADDDHYPVWESQSENFWDYDHAEIFLDVNNYLPDGLGPNNGIVTGHHIIGDRLTESGYGILLDNLVYNNLKWSYRLDGENLSVEYAIPFASLRQADGTQLNVNMVRDMRALGFDITINDRDVIKDSRDRMVWQNTGVNNEAYFNMDDCGTISLIDQQIVLDSVQVTFSVDMKNELIDNAGVFVGGSWNSWMSWVNPVPMLPIGSVYSATIKVPEGSTFDYKFKNGSTWESISGSCTSSLTDDRQLQLAGSDVVLNTVCFNNCAACEEQTDSVEVTFRVNMQNETVSANGVYLNGSWSYWQLATPMFLSNGVYTATVKLKKGESYTYKFINGKIDEYEKYEILTELCAVGDAGDRSLLVPQNNTTLDVVCFGKCFDCEYYLDRVAPVIVSMQPANQSVVDVSLNKLTITFSEDIVFGTGCIQLREASGQIVSQACAANWVITGNKLEVRIGNLAPSTSYYVTIASNAISDMAGNYFAGISDTTQYTFTTGSGQLTPHFTTVWTGNGTDHMNINITTVKLDGLDLEAGDEVALFDGNLCVGAGLVTATVSNTNVLVIKASSNEGSGNGYTAGHAITYKLYDRSADKEYTSVTATYSSSLPTWSTDGKYAVGATAFAQLNATATATQTIVLSKGWNIVSATVMPGNPNLMGIFQPLVNTATLRKVMNEAGGTIEDWGEYGGWKNEIGNFLPTEGYKVNVSADCSLSVEGTVVPLPMDIPLNAGWNIIGYPAQVAQNGKDAMQSLIDSGKLRKVMDEAGRTIEDWGSFGGWINNIGSFAPGKGYKVNVTSACTLRIAETSLKSMMVEPTIQHSDKFQSCFAGNGYNHMNINIVNLQQSGLSANDEIAIFDGDLCVGSATLSEGNMAQNRIAIAASANDGVSKKANGFTEGHPVQLKADHRGKVMETNLTDGKTFVQNGSLLIDLALFNQSLSSPSITKDADVFECYPNPLTSQLFIDVRNIRASDIDIAIYDVTGRKIKQVYSGANDGTTLYFWERGAALAGAYFCKVNGIVKKIIIID